MPVQELTMVQQPPPQVNGQEPTPPGQEVTENAAPTSQPIVGIIYPPPEVRNIVDKTASFVARNGPEFESRIRQNELGNPKFNFLNVGDPYHGYYQHKVKDFKEGKGQEPSATLTKGVTPAAQQKQQEILKQVEQPFVPKEPPPEFEFIADPPSISALDLDIVKLTAQFVARNGRQFLTNLMNREQRNFQFDFLRPQHSLFQYFTKLLEQYTKVLIPSKDLIPKLKDQSYNFEKILDGIGYRADWIKYQDAQKRKEEEELERERVAYAQIDWHDFVVVETVDYQQFEVGNFPPPTTPDEVGARVLMQERIEDGEDVEMQMESDDDTEILPRILDNDKDRSKDNNQVQDMEEESSSEEEEELAPPGESHKKDKGSMQPPPLPPTPGNVVIKKGYDPKQHASKAARPAPPDEYLMSPITGERIPASKVHEHMRIGLLDPRWVEQRDKHLDKLAQETVFAPGTAIEASLKQLAERRTDIFGVGDEETAIGKKIGEEDKKKDDKVTWDGHTSSVEAATRAARANITLEDQIHQIHKVKGLLHDEEKEKIGPKPVTRVSDLTSSAAAATKPQATVKAPPKPPAPKPMPLPPIQPVQQAPPPPQMAMPPMGMPQPMMGQPPMMMMAPMPPMAARPPPPLLAPNPFMPTPPSMPPMPPQMTLGKHPSDSLDDEPMSKKLRTEDSLIPEQQFLMRNNGLVQLNILTPLMTDKSEWKLGGQTLVVTLPVTESVATLKARISEQTNMPTGKQKLQYEGMFFKDSNTLAYYNLMSGNVINLLPKERGGRKK